MAEAWVASENVGDGGPGEDERLGDSARLRSERGLRGMLAAARQPGVSKVVVKMQSHLSSVRAFSFRSVGPAWTASQFVTAANWYRWASMSNIYSTCDQRLPYVTGASCSSFSASTLV
jgi:hypothetical protein